MINGERWISNYPVVKSVLWYQLATPGALNNTPEFAMLSLVQLYIDTAVLPQEFG